MVPEGYMYRGRMPSVYRAKGLALFYLRFISGDGDSAQWALPRLGTRSPPRALRLPPPAPLRSPTTEHGVELCPWTFAFPRLHVSLCDRNAREVCRVTLTEDRLSSSL